MTDIILVSIAALVIAINVLGGLFLYSRRYIKVPPQTLLVVYGRVVRVPVVRGYSVIRGGGRFVIPIFEAYGILPIEQYSIKIPIEDIRTKDDKRIYFRLEAQFKVCTQPEFIESALELFFEKPADVMKEAVRIKIVSKTVSLVVAKDYDEITKNAEAFTKELNAQIEKELKSIGIELMALVTSRIDINSTVNKDVYLIKEQLNGISDQIDHIGKELDALETARS